MAGPVAFLDRRAIEWPAVARAEITVLQSLEYRYPGPVSQLRQRLLLVPRRVHGSQRLLAHRLDVSAPEAEVRTRTDRFGNRVHRIDVPCVESAIRFETSFTVERVRGSHTIPCSAASAARYLPPTPLTAPDEALARAARALRASGADPERLAEAIMGWVHGALVYTADVTTVRTAAAEALALGRGVCQDYAHIMLALCRLCDLPARYVSGHLLGEGRTHAWVEVIARDPGVPAGYRAVPFDPTRRRRPDLTYVTVAVGRDYGDAAPTRGTFRARYGGTLTATKRAGVIAVERLPGR